VPALIFDCDGVLADTERYGHLPAFNQTFAEYDLPVRWSEEDYAEKLQIGGGKARMASLLTREFVVAAGLPTDPDAQREMVATWHRRKTVIYREMLADGRLPARPGVARLSGEAAELGFALSVASTSAEPAVRAVLEHSVGEAAAKNFAVFAGDIVPAKKPAPDIYLLALRELGTSADDAIVIEDSRKGLVAAVGASIRTVVTVSGYTIDEDFDGASLVVSSLGEPDGEVATVLDAAAGVRPEGFVRATDLLALLGTPRRKDFR
jgi:HAD superfamily hydrolase (TIGR01509 family)